MEETAADIAKRIKENLLNQYIQKRGGSPSSSTDFTSQQKDSCLPSTPSGKVKMWVNMCLEYDLKNNTVEVIKGPWTKLAGNTQVKKKTPKAPKVAEEAVVDEVETI